MTETETKELERPWECDDCGIKHTHFNDIDHNLRGVMLGPTNALRDLEYNPRCHCGWHELAHKIEEGEVTLPEPLEEFICESAKRLHLHDEVKEDIYG